MQNGHSHSTLVSGSLCFGGLARVSQLSFAVGFGCEAFEHWLCSPVTNGTTGAVVACRAGHSL